MSERKQNVEKKGYLEFSYPAEGGADALDAYQAGLRIVAQLRVASAFKKAAVVMQPEVLEALSTELSKLIVSKNELTYGQICNQIEAFSSNLPDLVKEVGPLTSTSAQTAFKGVLLSKLNPGPRF